MARVTRFGWVRVPQNFRALSAATIATSRGSRAAWHARSIAALETIVSIFSAASGTAFILRNFRILHP